MCGSGRRAKSQMRLAALGLSPTSFRGPSYRGGASRDPMAGSDANRKSNVQLHTPPRRQSPGGASPPEASVLPVQPDQLALNLDPVRWQDADLVGGVGWLQGDRGTAAAEALQCSFFFVDQRHHDIAGLGGLVAL